jgi:Phage integrase family
MRVKKVSIYIRLCGEPGRPFERLKVRNPRQCGERDQYCLRVAGKWEFFPEGDSARKDLNEALHRKGEREHELRIGVAAQLIPQRTAAQPGKTPVADAVQKYFDNLAAMGKDPKTIRTYRAALNGFVTSYKKPFIEDYERQDLIDYMGWLRKQPRKERKHANPDRTYFNKVSHVAIFLKTCGVRPGLKASEYPSYHEKQVVAHTDEELAERAGAKSHTELHKLRKTGASRRYRAGELLTTLMHELGHEDLSTTQQYLSDVKPEATKQAVAAADFTPSYALKESAAAEEEKSAKSKPASPKTAKVILNDTDAVVVTGTPSF